MFRDGVLALEPGLQGRRDHPRQIHVRRCGRIAVAQLERRAAGHRHLRADRRRSRRAGRDLGALGTVRPARSHNAAGRERREERRPGVPGRRATRAHRLPAPRVRRAVPAPRASTSVLVQALRARRAAEIAGRRYEAGRGGRHAGARVGNGPAHGDLREADAVRALLVASVVTLGAATPAPPFSVIVLPPGLRGMMSAVWIQNNRHWDELAGQNTLTQLLGTGRPTQREHQSAADLKQLQFAVAGNCDQVDRLVGTWHTHPYRAGPDGRALKERGLSALDLETFAAARDLITVVMWDMDSIDVAAKAPDGSVRHPVPLSLR